MYAISNWARHHVWTARLLLVILHVYLVGAAWWLAKPVFHSSPLSPGIAGIAALAAVWAMAFVKKIPDKKNRFRLQKLRFFVTGMGCLLLMISFFSTGSSFRYQLYGNLNGAFTEGSSKKERPAWEDYTDKEKYSSDLKTYYSSLSKKELRKELKYQLKSLREAGSGSSGWLVALVILLTVYAIIGVMILSCAIACNGNGAAAIVVLLLGTTSVIILAINLIKKIKRRNKKPEPVQEQPFINPTTE